MKHLSNYGDESKIEYINDIACDLKDMGCDVYVGKTSFKDCFIMTFCHGFKSPEKNNEFNIEIEIFRNRLEDLMGYRTYEWLRNVFLYSGVYVSAITDETYNEVMNRFASTLKSQFKLHRSDVFIVYVNNIPIIHINPYNRTISISSDPFIVQRLFNGASVSGLTKSILLTEIFKKLNLNLNLKDYNL